MAEKINRTDDFKQKANCFLLDCLDYAKIPYGIEEDGAIIVKGEKGEMILDAFDSFIDDFVDGEDDS